MPQIDKPNYLCVGCGACAYSCPKQCITYVDNPLGQYVPSVDYDKCIECKLCEKRCPIYSASIPQKHDGIQYNPITGEYISCYKGYDEKFRPTSASGGFLTAVLYNLLDTKSVDNVVCVINNHTESSFYQYDIVSEKDDLLKNSRSAYYPMEISSVLRYIRDNEGKYAIVVLPCQAKAIREIQRTDYILRERIMFLLGLVCGGMPGKDMVEYIALDNGLNVKDVQSISFREKSIADLNRQYSVTLRVTEYYSVRSRFPDEAFGFSYLNKLFHYRACNICDDIYAEFADAVFMDAWLPEHRDDKLGTSICIIRNKTLDDILTSYFANNTHCEPVNISIAIEAQNCVGLIQRKKKQSYFKRSFYHRLGYVTPEAKDIALSIAEKIKFFIRATQELLIQNKSSKLWIKFKQGAISFNKYKGEMKRFIKLVKKI
ncbi:Coenzyme F420 hydrogenase/dehydrogenase, beta subunit C-terminal domain [Bacteroides caecimuris]|uniref:Coenzyme F420 hydrogenase/dehydrogenase, beta subunit C-terminal domain n=1 Tax=Bacteroides caecimuris TaxID=1796613 RepID=UPI00266030E2|nr:Coenzyme F420 hydrogenase/dehydrogenase, beta subunit C-terminal domain [Bacteroides caecimuris]